jgi:tRNA (cmo5U34)-methyltransferase
MRHDVRRHLRVEIEAYDGAIRRWIPGYGDMIAAAAGAVAEVSPRHVLDLGAGTGALAAAILRHPEVGLVELVDVDRDMLDRARDRLRPFGGRARFTLRSFADPLPSCDAVAASLALHHVRTLDDKAALFRRIFQALRPGGVFVNADATMPSDEAGRVAGFAAWAAHMARSGIDEAQARAHFVEWAEEDTYFPLEDELATLVSAGFEARCVWRREPSTVVVARRP